jgi:hypothetical protein
MEREASITSTGVKHRFHPALDFSRMQVGNARDVVATGLASMT